jgi:hypothetical protein
MPAYVVKIIHSDGSPSPPLIASCSSEEEAIRLVRTITVRNSRIEIMGLGDAAMKLAFGHVPEGSAVFRHDWKWSLDGEKPEPQ